MLRVLIVEDSEADAELIVREIRRGSSRVESLRVDDESSMRDALAGAAWDVVISDWSMPSFGALAALDLLGEAGLDLPFIIVSGTIGEESAVAAMRRGAHDYVLKDKLARLLPAIERERAQVEVRRARKQAEAAARDSKDALKKAEKLRALGQMAAGVAHDLKNILNPLSLHLQFVERAIAAGDLAAATESVVEMKGVVTRGVQSIERLRDYGRQSREPRTEAIDLNRIIGEAMQIAHPRLAQDPSRAKRIRQDLGTPPIVMGRSEEILNALVNLIINAIDAVPRGGTITLRTGEIDAGGGWIEVEDDGPGMSPDVASRVFEPFFTTKGEGGTGLGLAMVYACMERHGGTITLETEPEEGTRFTLSFPGGESLRQPDRPR